MKIRFDTALFGEIKKAHALLSSSDHEFAKSLTAISDLPIELPNTSGHLPMMSGFPHQGRYVFLSSIRDKDASRNGMAKTTSLITEIGNLKSIHNLGQLFDQLSYFLPHYIDERAIDIEFEDSGDAYQSPGTVVLVRALIANRSTQPVVWVGNDGFQEALNGLWRGLPHALKSAFTFRFCCTPRDGRSRTALLIQTPVELRSRWNSHMCIQPPFDDAPGTHVERLFTDELTRKRVSQWGEELDAEISSFEMFRLMADSQTTYQQLTSVSDLDVTVISRNLARLVPDPLKGKRIKGEVFRELESRITTGPLETVGYLRNIVASEYQDGFDIIRRATASRFAKAFIANDSHLLKFTHEAMEDGARPWSIGVVAAFTNALVQKEPAALEVFRNLITSSTTGRVHDWLARASDFVTGLEGAMLPLSSIRSLSQLELRRAADFCKRTDWSRLHARIICMIMSPADSLDEQLSLPDKNGTGIAELSRCLGPREFAKVAVSHEKSPQLLDQIVAGCIADITTLDLFDVTNVTWRTAICSIIRQARESIDLCNVLDGQVQMTWQFVVEGSLNDVEYLKALSSTKYANILEIDKRSTIWVCLPNNLQRPFCEATTRAWLQRNVLDGPPSERPEEPLKTEILLSKYRSRLLPVTGASAIAKSRQVFNVLPELCAQDFDEWRIRLLSTQRQLKETDARLIGMLVAQKKWKTSAHGLLDDYTTYSRRDLHPALCECASLFGWITRHMNSLSKERPTVDQWWDELATILIYLYPEGPRDKHVWERAGGYTSDLSANTTGREQWKSLFSELRKGAELGDATIHSLIEECRSDYSTNAELSLLVDNCPFHLEISRNDAFLD